LHPPHPDCPAEPAGIPIPRVFWKKRLQTIENKGSECGKERQEKKKRRQAAEKMGFATETERYESGKILRTGV
jgi:hypothetical protein